MPAAWLATLPPLQLDSLALDRAHGTTEISFATGGEDDEHVRLDVEGGKLARALIARTSKEGKESDETRAGP